MSMRMLLGCSLLWVLASAGCSLGRRDEPQRVASPAGDAAWLVRAQEHIAEREYRVSENGEGLQAPNRRHNLRTYFGTNGIRVYDRSAEGSPELLQLSLVAVGRGDAVAAVGPGETVEADAGRVEIRRPGLVEWYLNSPAGLEQGFTFEVRAPGDDPLVVEIAARGARLALQGDAIHFSTGDRKLRYGNLVARDAAGRTLASHFELAGAERLRLVVDDSGAEYPIEIDPLLTETADTTIQSNQKNAFLGRSVAGAGDVNGDGYADVIVGADQYDAGFTDEGAAFVFLGGAAGVADGDPSSAVTQLESNQALAAMGISVASAGDVNGDGYDDVIVGAYGFDAGTPDEGAAFVFLGSATGIADGDPSTAAAQLEADQGAAFMGNSVAAAGDVNGDGYADVIVGAYGFDAGTPDEGAAFVFLGSEAGIADGNPSTAVAQLEANQAGARMAGGVAGAGDVNGDGFADVIVGADRFDAGENNEGAAFVFLGSAAGVSDGDPSTAATRLESNQASASMGLSVAGAGDVNGDGYGDVIVGAEGFDAGEAEEGAAFVFLGSASGIADGDPSTAAAQLEANEAIALMGGSVAGAGDVNGDGYADVVVGAYEYTLQGKGAAFVFMGSATGIADGDPSTAAAQIEAIEGAFGLGTSVAGAGDVNGDGYADLIIGAPYYSVVVPSELTEGAAFLYLGGPSGLSDGNPLTAAAQIDTNQSAASLGVSVAGAGDVNGDGYADVIVGAEDFDAGETDEGAAFVFLGGAAGIADGDPSTAAAQLESNQASAFMGTSVAGAGDVNGDGYADVIVGANEYDSGETDEGAAFVFVGSATGIADGNPSTAAARLESDQAASRFGWSVAGADDVNGDGFGDVIVGAEGFDAGENDEGAAFVFLGSAAGIADGDPLTAAAQLEANQSSAFMGTSVAGAGDVNGDGHADVIVGATSFDAGENNEGAAFVFLGSATGIADGDPSTAATQLESNQASAQMGASTSGAGDVNGDGFADVIVGAPRNFDSGQMNEGKAFVFLGSATGIADGNPSTASARLEANQGVTFLGGSVAGAGDVNGDGYADVVVGADRFDAGENNEGAAFVFLGSATGIADGNPSTAAAQLESNQFGANLGVSVAGAGDVNGDGYADVIVGANGYEEGELDEGAAFVFLGNGRAARPVLARQRRPDGTPVQSWGSSFAPGAFSAELVASHPAGTGRVRAEFEVCPVGVAFEHPSCASALSPTWVAVNGATPQISLSTTFGLPSEGLYRWRARRLHAPSSGAIPSEPAHGPWRRLDARADEADIRVVPEPHWRIALASGAALLASLGRRRRRSPIEKAGKATARAHDRKAGAIEVVFEAFMMRAISSAQYSSTDSSVSTSMPAATFASAHLLVQGPLVRPRMSIRQ